ncbi:MAG: hypothetical protein CVV58_06865 [Tenericutes bacterium HGW-Tenericutes-3]|nr:MAG: hypothetical protein CVV58_06865 [Tenericutes bacterium HGW-Tenericutes-3]
MDQREAIFKIVIDMLEEAHERLTRESLVSKTVGIKLKNTSFETMNRGKTLDFHTDDYDVFYDTIEQLFEAHYDESPVRLVGVFLSSVMQKKDLKIDFNLFNYQELSKREESLYQTIKDINDTYPGKIQKGTKKTS